MNSLMEIITERHRQRSMWGDEHDDGHSSQDWYRFIRPRLDEFYDSSTTEIRRHELLVHIGALVFAALESDEREELATQT